MKEKLLSMLGSILLLLGLSLCFYPAAAFSVVCGYYCELVADAGFDQIVSEGDMVQLQASGYSVNNRDLETYFWWDSSPTVTLGSQTISNPTCIAPVNLAADPGWGSYSRQWTSIACIEAS